MQCSRNTKGGSTADGHSVEKREQELRKKIAMVETDKRSIEGTIAELDRYKRDALAKTWEKVNQ